MAEALLKDSKLKLVFEDGLDEKGNPTYKSKTFSNVRLESTPDSLQQVAQAVASLSQKNLFGVERNDSSDIQA